MSANATLLDSKNVQSVTRGSGVGFYCVKVAPRAVNDLPTAAIVATLSNYRGEITAIGAPHSSCGNDANTITVVTSDSSGQAADRPFTVAVLQQPVTVQWGTDHVRSHWTARAGEA
ncbi:hypothetical protein ACIBLA_32695 [Streptomyces sp. NPDC050433]|uniref:hypothetical protein n=1 Tax=unclassified Streptomyces TaxID=2593676 RepID=UPI00342886D5